MRRWLVATIMAVAASGEAAAEEAGAKALAPGGTLRVAIGVAPAPSAFYVTLDPASGKPKGVAVDLGTALAARLGVPVAFVQYPGSGAIVAAAESGAWDVTFLPVDAERARAVAFGAAYNLFESTYLARPGTDFRRVDDVDRAGVRVVGVEGTTTIRAAERALKQAGVRAVKSVDAAMALLRAGEADAVALGRSTLVGLAPMLPGSRILEGRIHATSTAIALPKSRATAQALADASAFIEEAKAAGLVRRALDDAGLKDAAAAPPGAR